MATNPESNNNIALGSGRGFTPPSSGFTPPSSTTPLPASVSIFPNRSVSTMFKPNVPSKVLWEKFPLTSAFVKPRLAPKGVTVIPVSV